MKNRILGNEDRRMYAYKKLKALLYCCKQKQICDNSNLNAGYVTNFGGNYSNGDNAGVCYLNVNNSASNSNANIGGHVIFLYSLYRKVLIALPLLHE